MTEEASRSDEPTSIHARLEGIATRWSLVQLAHQTGHQDAAQARNALVLKYSAATRRYLAAFAGDEADDLAQEVMVHLLQGGLSGADRERGRFRDYLKTTIRNYVRNHWSRSRRRQFSTLPDDIAENEDELVDRQWLIAWQRSVLEHAFEALEDFENSRPTSFAATIVRLRLDHPDATSEELAERLTSITGKPFRADALRQLLRRARFKFAECIVDEIATGLAHPTPGAVAEELAAVELLEHVKDFLPDDWITKGVLRVPLD